MAYAPAMELGLTDNVWPISTLIEADEVSKNRPHGRQGRFRVIDDGRD